MRMHSHGLRDLLDHKPVASCQRTCYKLTIKTCYPRACCKLFQQVVTSLQTTSCKKPDFNRLVETWSNWQVRCNLLTRFFGLCIWNAHVVSQQNATTCSKCANELLNILVISELYQMCCNNLVTSVVVHLLRVVDSLLQTCYNKLGTSSAYTHKLVDNLWTDLLQLVCAQTCDNLCILLQYDNTLPT